MGLLQRLVLLSEPPGFSGSVKKLLKVLEGTCLSPCSSVRLDADLRLKELFRTLKLSMLLLLRGRGTALLGSGSRTWISHTAGSGTGCRPRSSRLMRPRP
ncbi:mCG148217 [Mus musculus]|nr:mCG148217 [Mus musculus]